MGTTTSISSPPNGVCGTASPPSAIPSSDALAITLPPELLEQIAQRAAELVLAAQPAPAASPWLSVAEAAEYLRAPRSRLYSLVSAGRIPHVKDGSRTLFDRGALDAWLHNGGGKRP